MALGSRVAEGGGGDWTNGTKKFSVRINIYGGHASSKGPAPGSRVAEGGGTYPNGTAPFAVEINIYGDGGEVSVAENP